MIRLLRFLKPYKTYIAFVILFVFLESITELMLPNYMSDIVENGILKMEIPPDAAEKIEALGGMEKIASGSADMTIGQLTDMGVKIGDIPYIWQTGAIMLIVAVLGAIMTVAAGYLSSKTSMGMGRDIRKVIFKKGMDFSLSEFDTLGTASMITRTTNDVQHIQMLVLMFLRMVLRAPILGIGGIIMAVSKNARLSLIFLVSLPVIALLIFGISKKAVPLFKIMQKKLDALNLVARERLTGIRVIRAYDKEDQESVRFDAANRDLTDTGIKVNRIMAAIMPALMITMNFTVLAVVWFGARRINVGLLNIGDMMAFIQYAMLILMSLIMLSIIFVMIPRASASAERINEVLDMEPSIRDKANSADVKVAKGCAEDSGLRGCIEFRNVTFSYPGAEEPVLYDINFQASPGEVTAIIGSTGSGKSTLINLIPRFYDIQKGQILVDGVDISDISQHDLREMIGYVPQNAVLFTGTIADNLRYGDENASIERIERAAKIAQAHDFILNKKEGFDESISQGGTNVSGGQKQRISIARAIVKEPEIYIFDDSFSALDYKTDKKLREELRKHIEDATLIIVAQRISTVRDADRIIVLNEGRIAGIGKHDELLASNEIYKEIVYSQLPEDEVNGK